MDRTLMDLQIVEFPCKKFNIFRYNGNLKKELKDDTLYFNRTFGNMFMLLSGKQLKRIEKIEKITWYIMIDDSECYSDYPCEDDDYECPVINQTTDNVTDHIRKIDELYNLVMSTNNLNAFVGSEYMFSIMLKIEFNSGKIKSYSFDDFLNNFIF